MTDLSKLISLKDAAALVGCTVGKLRREAKKGAVPGAVQVLGHWGFISDELQGYEVPESGSFGGGSKRSDGRLTFKIYLTDEEAKTLTDGGFELVDPRVARAERKAKQAAEKVAAGGNEEVPTVPVAVPGAPAPPPVEEVEADPFADFGL